MARYTSELCKTTNKATNKVYYYMQLFGKLTRVSKLEYKQMKDSCSRVDMFLTTTDKTHTRKYEACHYCV